MWAAGTRRLPRATPRSWTARAPRWRAASAPPPSPSRACSQRWMSTWPSCWGWWTHPQKRRRQHRRMAAQRPAAAAPPPRQACAATRRSGAQSASPGATRCSAAAPLPPFSLTRCSSWPRRWSLPVCSSCARRPTSAATRPAAPPTPPARRSVWRLAGLLALRPCAALCYACGPAWGCSKHKLRAASRCLAQANKLLRTASGLLEYAVTWVLPLLPAGVAEDCSPQVGTAAGQGREAPTCMSLRGTCSSPRVYTCPAFLPAPAFSPRSRLPPCPAGGRCRANGSCSPAVRSA